MDRDRLFVETVDWLEQVGRTQDHLHLLMGSGRIRLLLLDGDPLLHQVNRERRLRIGFTIRRTRIDDIPVRPDTWASPTGIHPASCPEAVAGVEAVPLKIFLAEPVLFHQGVQVNVADLVRYSAHVAGGVHAGTSSSPAELAVEDLAEKVFVNELPLGTACLTGVTRVVVDALRPLRDLIGDRPTTPPYLT